jgi:hypothetical protein
LTYFQVNRDSQQTEWEPVQASLTLAIRVNHNRFVTGPRGNISGERNLVLKAIEGAAEAAMQFSLFVVPGEGAAS